MQTIIGSGGTIGLPLAKELKKYTNDIRLVSRHPKKVNESDDLFPMDVSDFKLLDKAIEGSDIVYITIGFDYNLKVWQTSWVPFMQAVISGCKKHHSKLVFFDNVYLYAKSAIPYMTENSLIQPPSKKGEVRKQLHEMLMAEAAQNTLSVVIARSADFYGPDTNKSMLGEVVVKNLIKGKSAQAFGSLAKIHTYTYTPDAAMATAILGNTDDAYHQVWHVPTTKDKLTSKQWIELVASELEVEPKIQKIPTWVLYALGIFNPMMKEFPEMMYQNELDYIFDSSKFENRFGIYATTPKDGIRSTIDYFKRLNRE